jgi:CheY-like chemotaxis protein
MPKRILVVDDVKDWQQALSGLLEDEGYQVIAVGDRKSALEAIKANKFGLAILDIRLDETDENNAEGLDLAGEVKGIQRNLPVVIITGYETPDYIDRAIRPDKRGRSLAADFMRKMDAEELVGVVNKLFNSVGYQLEPTPSFKPVSDCNLTISIEDRQSSLIRARGLITFTHTSRKPLDLDPRRFTRRGDELQASPSWRFNLKEIGRELYRLLFLEHSPLLSGYHRGLGKVSRANRLNLIFETPRDFIGIPLESLFSDDSGEYLALTHPLTRRIGNVTTEREPLSPDFLNRMRRRNQKLRVLLVTSDTEPPIAAIDAIGIELQALLAEHDWISVDLIPTSDATYERIRRELRKCQYHVVQYVGHGLYDEASPEQSSLFFWEKANRSGQVKPMKASELKLLLQNSEVLLLHLTCCEGTREGNPAYLLDDDFLGIADAAIQAGVPSVVGFRWPVSVRGARKFAVEFYQSLVNQGSPELALLEARRELAMLSRDDPTWASPILIVQR